MISVDKPGTAANEPEPGTATNVPSTTDYMQQLADEEAFEMYNIVAEFAKNNYILTDNTGGQVLDFDEAFFEMARSLEEIENDGDNIVEVRRLIEGWIEAEDTEYCREFLPEEVHTLMDVDAMCKLSKVAEEVEDEADVTTLELKEPVMFDEVIKIATMIKCYQCMHVSLVKSLVTQQWHSMMPAILSGQSTRKWRMFAEQAK